jgi:hypothetical protein
LVNCKALPGFYADVQNGCEVFHVCSRNSLKMKNSFLCPNGSVFNQVSLTCDSWDHVDCSVSENYYGLNTAIGKAEANVYHFDTNRNKFRFSSKLDVFTSKETEREETSPVAGALLLVTVLLPSS